MRQVAPVDVSSCGLLCVVIVVVVFVALPANVFVCFAVVFVAYLMHFVGAFCCCLVVAFLFAFCCMFVAFLWPCCGRLCLLFCCPVAAHFVLSLLCLLRVFCCDCFSRWSGTLAALAPCKCSRRACTHPRRPRGLPGRPLSYRHWRGGELSLPLA